MGLLSTLGKIGAGIAAPFTGGASLAAIPAIDAIGQVAGAAGGGMGNARMNANQQALMQDRNKLDAYRAQQDAILQALGMKERGALDRANLDLNQRTFALNAPNVRGRQALFGSLLQNLQPVSMSGIPSKVAAKMPTISGGLSPAALGPGARDFGALLQKVAMEGQQKGDTFDPIEKTDFMAGLMEAPQLSQLKQAGFLEKLLGGIGLGGSLLGGILGAGGGSGGGLNNAMPSPYTGRDMYGNQANFRLPMGTLS